MAQENLTPSTLFNASCFKTKSIVLYRKQQKKIALTETTMQNKKTSLVTTKRPKNHNQVSKQTRSSQSAKNPKIHIH
ncbi:hypothetical protein E1A91_D08G216500v1 [Gossypium mustelinum]|uniref:Uncharacterized protein n=2 Tax=Gossypium TaxID=3633 RepID=A0A5J5QH62_GOSBA|nr:hypothetical protein ES319_D08G214700v1 [Gossypium barbadense]TYI70368.1 hypothetical protein E1A91_D08G216500v1 [Gossypium mustelinum]